jgi:hydrogenase-1 operon protein HyaF
VNQVLQDIHAALTAWQVNGTPQAIDLRQLPWMSAEVYQDLQGALLQGEVTAVIQAQVKVEVTETQYPGVWWLRHFNERDEITTEIIEVTEIPAILLPHRVDMLAGLRKLDTQIRLRTAPTQPCAEAP